MKKFLLIYFLMVANIFAQGTKPPTNSLNGLSDVTITSPTNGQSLLYNSTSHLWINGPVATPALADLSDVAVSSTSTNQVLKWDSVSGKWTNYGPIAFSDVTGSVAPSQMNGGLGATSTTVWKGDGTWGSVPSAGTVVPTTSVLVGDGSGNAVDTVSGSPQLNMTSTALTSTNTNNGDFLVNWVNNGSGANAAVGLRMTVADGYAEIKTLGSSFTAVGVLTPDDLWIRQHMSPSGPKSGNLIFSTAGDQMRYSNDDGITLRALIGNGLSVGSATDPGIGIINAQNGFRVANGAVANKVLKGDGTNFSPSTEKFPATPGSNGNIMTSNGTDWVSSAPTSGGTVTSITATSPIVATPSSIIATGVLSLNAAVDLALTVAQTTTMSTAATNVVVPALTLTENSSGTAANGLGVGIGFKAESSTTNSQDQAAIQSAWSDATHATRTAYLDFLLENNAAIGAVSKMRLYGPGNLNVGNTTDPAFTTGGLITANTGFRVGTAASTSGKILKSDGTSFTASSDTFATAASNSGKLMQSDGTNWTASTVTWPSGAVATTGKVVTSNGVNYVASTPTFPTNATPAVGKIMISDATNFVLSTPAYPNAASTLNKFIKSDGANFITTSVTWPDASATTNKVVKSDGTNWTASTETYAAPGTAGNVMTSAGGNWTSAAPPAYASYQGVAGGVTPAGGSSSTTGLMMGLGGVATITPTATGKVLFAVSGQLNSGSAGCQVAFRWGTGTAPINGASATGVGNQIGGVAGQTASVSGAFSLTSVKTGLAVGTAVWMDCVVIVASGTAASISSVGVTATELP